MLSPSSLLPPTDEPKSLSEMREGTRSRTSMSMGFELLAEGGKDVDDDALLDASAIACSAATTSI